MELESVVVQFLKSGIRVLATDIPNEMRVKLATTLLAVLDDRRAKIKMLKMLEEMRKEE